MADKLIDTDKFSQTLRQRGIDDHGKRVLLTRFTGSEQERDLSLPSNCDGFGRIHHFKRDQGTDWPANPLPIDPAAHHLGLETIDTIRAQVFQNAVCSWRCWYCFVDFKLLAGDSKYSEFKSVSQLIDCYLSQENRPPIIDLSGGQPDLVPEWLLWFADELQRRKLSSSVYLWSDDNLSNDYLWRHLKETEIQRLASYSNYGRVGCFKGFDEESFSFNTKAEPELFNRQFGLMRRLVNAGFDVYGYGTFTSPHSNLVHRRMSNFLDRLQEEIHPNFPLRLVPLKIVEYSPTSYRMNDRTTASLAAQYDAINAWNEELERRFSAEERAKEIYKHSLEGRL